MKKISIVLLLLLLNFSCEVNIEKKEVDELKLVENNTIANIVKNGDLLLRDVIDRLKMISDTVTSFDLINFETKETRLIGLKGYQTQTNKYNVWVQKVDSSNFIFLQYPDDPRGYHFINGFMFKEFGSEYFYYFGFNSSFKFEKLFCIIKLNAKLQPVSQLKFIKNNVADDFYLTEFIINNKTNGLKERLINKFPNKNGFCDSNSICGTNNFLKIKNLLNITLVESDNEILVPDIKFNDAFWLYNADYFYENININERETLLLKYFSKNVGVPFFH